MRTIGAPCYYSASRVGMVDWSLYYRSLVTSNLEVTELLCRDSTA